MDGYNGWTRISEFSTVEITFLPEPDVISNQIKTIERQIQEISDEAIKKVDELKQKRAELMALSCD